jgi:phage shock protein PspC (stress-responsive transcriptional regulator)
MADIRLNDYRLLRARDGRMLAGVAAGLAGASGMDVTLVRLCIGAMMISGFGVPAYILMWIILPEESMKRGLEIEPAPEQTGRIIRIALVGLAVLSVFNKVGGFSITNPHARGFGLDGVFGLLLVGAGIAILLTRHRPDRALWDAPSPPSRPMSASAPVGDDVRYEDDDEPRTFTGPFSEVVETVHGALSDAFSEVRTTISESRPRSSTTAAADDEYDDYGDLDDDEPPSRPFPVVTVTGRTNNSGGGALVAARIVGWLVLIWWTLASLAIAAAWALGGATLRSPLLLAVSSGLVFIGVLNTLLHAKFARAIVPALALLLIPIGIAATTVRVNGDMGDYVFNPTDASKPMNYRLAAGRMRIDLVNTKFDGPATVNARLTVGQLIVTVPDDARVTINSKTDSFGGYEIFGQRDQNGSSPDIHRTYEGCPDGPKLTLNLRTGIGEIDVLRANGHSTPTCPKAA